jgi:hypothetical protein
LDVLLALQKGLTQDLLLLEAARESEAGESRRLYVFLIGYGAVAESEWFWCAF